MNTLDVLAETYLEMRCDLGQFSALRRSTLTHYLHDFVEWMKSAAQVSVPEKVSSDVIHAWHRYASAKHNKKSGLPLLPGSIYTYVITIRAFCLWLHKNGHLSDILIENFPRMIPPPMRLQLALHHSEVRAFLDALPSSNPDEIQFRALAEFLYTSGVRAGEAVGLDIDDVDLNIGLARVLGKGRKERMVPIGKTARHWMEVYLVGVRPLLLTRRDEPAFWLMLGGQRMSYYCLRGRFQKAVRDQDGPPIRPHVLRRSCATELLRSGASVWAVKELLGHENLETLEYYALLDMNDLKEMHMRCHPRDLQPSDEDLKVPEPDEPSTDKKPPTPNID